MAVNSMLFFIVRHVLTVTTCSYCSRIALRDSSLGGLSNLESLSFYMLFFPLAMV